MIPNSTPSQANMPNTVMPANMMGPGTVPTGSLNLDERKKQKKLDEEKRQKKKLTYFLFGVSILGLIFYSIFFFYPHLTAYIQAPNELERLQTEIDQKNTEILALQEEKGLHQAAYTQETDEKIARVDVLYPPYNKLSIIKDIENAANTLSAFGTFEMNAITVEPPVPEALGWVTLVAGTFRADEEAFRAFMEEYVGDSGNLEKPNSTITKAFRQINVKPVEIKSVRVANNQTVTEPGYNVSFQLAFYTRAEQD